MGGGGEGGAERIIEHLGEGDSEKIKRHTVIRKEMGFFFLFEIFSTSTEGQLSTTSYSWEFKEGLAIHLYGNPNVPTGLANAP